MKITDILIPNGYTSPIEVNEIEIEPNKIIVLTGNGFSFKRYLVELIKKDTKSNNKSVLDYDYSDCLLTERWSTGDISSGEVKGVIDEINELSDDIIGRTITINTVIVNTQSKELIRHLFKKTADISCYLISDLSYRTEINNVVDFKRKYNIQKITIKI